MLLEWMLTGDIDAVLSMADQYGGWRVDDQGAARIQPATLSDILLKHAIDESLLKDERGKEAVRRASCLILPARQEIFDALRTGSLHGWARRNGSGDLTKIEPIQWVGLRFSAVDGHDIAVPVDSEGEPLSLPHPLSDYVAGSVPAILTPTVWPDPVFPADEVMRLWPERQAGSSDGLYAATRPCQSEPDREPKPKNSRRKRPGPTATANDIRDAAEQLIASNQIPGRTVKWKAFHQRICQRLDVGVNQRGYSLETIRIAVRSLLRKSEEQNTEST